MLGVVQRGDEIGALARNKATGSLVMMRAGAVSMLDQRKAAAALAVQRCRQGLDLASRAVGNPSISPRNHHGHK